MIKSIVKFSPVRPFRACALALMSIVLAMSLTACKSKTFEEADRDNDWKALVGDFKVYDACYDKQFQGDECERWRLKASNNPEFWPYPNVPPVKWPEPPKERVYKKGMEPFEYFQALCEAEAGEWIYKKVEDVKSIYMIRPRKEEKEVRIRERYGMEDPYGHGQGDEGDEGYYSLIGAEYYSHLSTPKYRFVEAPIVPLNIHRTRLKYFHPSMTAPIPDRAHFRRFTYAPEGRGGHYGMSTVISYSAELESRYGYVWRDIRRPYDREMGVAGGELIVVDLQTNEILGLRRGFIFGSRLKTGGIWWLTGRVCPRYSQMPGLGQIRRRDKDGDYTTMFLTKVATPKGELVSLEEGRRRRQMYERERIDSNNSKH